MSLFQNTPVNDTQNAMDTLSMGQQGAASSLAPYTNNAGSDFNNERKYLYQSFGQMGQYGNPASQFYGYSEENPLDLLNEIMGGYSMSIGAQNQLKNSLSSANNMATTTGMYGSGDNDALDAEITNQIEGEDQSAYLKNVGGVVDDQQKFIQDFQSQMHSLMKAFSSMTGQEYGASGQMADIDKSLSQTGANIYSNESNANKKNRGAQALGAAAGMATKAFLL